MKLREFVGIFAETLRMNGADPMDIELRGVDVKDLDLRVGPGGWTIQIGPTDADKRARERQLDELAAEAHTAIENLRKATR